ncbi:hypothetical protein [Rhodopseudomonas sp.]|uniref:hypothetical protein n=1 Tax=Rhodopseudomonas sp. TaxID=1078 RepID=UPI003B3B82AA
MNAIAVSTGSPAAVVAMAGDAAATFALSATMPHVAIAEAATLRRQRACVMLVSFAKCQQIRAKRRFVSQRAE